MFPGLDLRERKFLFYTFAGGGSLCVDRCPTGFFNETQLTICDYYVTADCYPTYPTTTSMLGDVHVVAYSCCIVLNRCIADSGVLREAGLFNLNNRELLLEISHDFSRTWWQVLLCCLLTLVLCFLYVRFLQRNTAVIAWGTVVLVVLALLGLTAFLWVECVLSGVSN